MFYSKVFINTQTGESKTQLLITELTQYREATREESIKHYQKRLEKYQYLPADDEHEQITNALEQLMAS